MKDKKIKCLYSKCETEFVPKNTKTKFCCAVHRVMWHREQGKMEELIAENNLPANKKKIEKARNGSKRKIKPTVPLLTPSECIDTKNKNKGNGTAKNGLTGMALEIWEEEQRILNSKNKQNGK
jgi:hypothetical protein